MERNEEMHKSFGQRESIYLQCKSMKSFMCQGNTKGVT